MWTRTISSIAIMLTISLVSGENKIDSPIPCRNTSDCMNVTTLPRETFCKNGFCMCPGVNGGEVKNCSSVDASIQERRDSGPLVFRTCKHDQDCNFKAGFCNTTINQCDCLKGYVPSSNKQYCVEKAQSIDSPCVDKNQCLAFLANTTCDSNKCVCKSGYHYADNACWKKVDYGQPCTKTPECSHIEGVVCIADSGTCECAAETVLNADGERCLTVARSIFEECVESAQCTMTFEHSSCIDKQCQCQEGYHYESDMTRCFLNREIDTYCANNYECYQTENAKDYKTDPAIKSLVCEANKCTCADNYLRLEDRCVNVNAMNACISLIASLSVIALLMVLICSLSL